MDALVPLLLALSGLPALGVAGWTLRNDDARSRGLALRWALIGLSILIGAIALYWAGADRTAVNWVIGVLVVAVNGLAISMLLFLRRGGRPGPRR